MKILRIGFVLIGVVILGYSLIYAVVAPYESSCNLLRESQGKDSTMICPRYSELFLSLIVAISALATLFGTLSLSGATTENGSFKEGRIRLSIALTVLVTYIVYFSLAVFWPDNTQNLQMLETLTNLIMIVVPFYFGSSVAAEWAERKRQE